MAKLSYDQLERALERGLAPVYLVTGDEPLLVQESCDRIRMAAKRAGFLERELFHTDVGFQWPQVLQSANSMSLFSEQKLIEVRMHSSKPGDAGSKVVQEYCAAPARENLLLLVCPKLDRASQNSKWFKALESTGAVVTLWPINSKQLPRWIDQRLQKAGIRADSHAIEILAGKVEGNLLAAAQEIEKLKLLTNSKIIDSQMMASAVVDSARYDVFSLVDKALSGDCRGAATTLNGLRAEGTEAAVILWALSREIRALIAIKHAQSQGQKLEFVARKHGIFDSRLGVVRGGLQRISTTQLQRLLKECAQVDRAIKGMTPGSPWSPLLDLTLALAGTHALSPKTLDALLK